MGWCYDAAGNLLAEAACGAATYVYNAENQMTSTAGVTYKYDGDGKRVWKTSGKLYWYGTGSDPVMETDLSGNLTDEYIFFGGKRIARRDSSGNVVYYMTDHLGTSRIVTSSAGAILDESDFYPFGGERVITFSSGNTYKFTGKERDSESGLDNFEARYLGSSLGRFMSPDPMGGKTEDPQSLNRYAYVRNNPLTLTDPSGMNFGLPCSGGNTDTCNNGLQGSWQHDQDGNKTTFDPVSIGNKDGTLQDLSSNKTGTYTASFDGSNVSLTNSGGTAQNGSWLQGTAAVSGVSGGGNLSSKFDFTFSDHGNGQSLNATFTYAGKFSEAQSELYKAGYSFSALDQMFNVREMFANPNAENYRTPGDPGTGANSGHFLVNHSIVSLLPQYSVPTTGSVHTGETNPTTSPGALWQHWTKEQ
jgi:RHS repeat-associated protein